MKVGQQHLFVIHLLTASGAALALLSVLAAFSGDWSAVFIWLGLALLVDGIDGPLARRFHIRERLPKWDGAAIDVVIDYATYVFVPAIILARAMELPPLLGTALGIVVTVTAALYYADTRMKQPDNSFRGFPVVWNMAVFVLFAFLPPPEVTTAVVLILAILTFMPVNFVHPVRVMRWRNVTLGALAVWLLSGTWLLATDFTAPDFVKFVLLGASVYLLGVSAVQQLLRTRSGARGNA
jgi:phosphatidylcholine synthase